MKGSQSPDDGTARLRAVDAAIASSRAAMLTPAQTAQIRTLRQRLQTAFDGGETAEIARLTALILSIVREGPPSLF